MGDFDLQYVLNKFNECISTESPDDILLNPYCNAFKEIARFFSFINIGFSFVGSNVNSSCYELLQAQEHSKDPPILFLREALIYDIQFNGNYQTYSSIIWLHRPLEFILGLFEDFSSLDVEETPCSQIAIKNYFPTMGRFHSWPIKQMTKLLFYTLPDWKNLRLNTMKTDQETTKALMKEIISIGKIIYEKTENMIQHHENYLNELLNEVDYN